jgi:hypothetical protein
MIRKQSRPDGASSFHDPSAPPPSSDHHAGLAPWIGCVCLALATIIHVEYLSNVFTLMPYVGILSVGLIVASVASVMLLMAGDRRGWFLGVFTSALSIIASLSLRLADSGSGSLERREWHEPSGIASLALEMILIAVAVITLRSNRHNESDRPNS